MQWPKDNQTARNAFYGDPGSGDIPAQMVPVSPPFAMYYTDDNGKVSRVKAIMFHRKAAPYLLAALNEIWDYCQHSQARIDASGASKYFGAYNHRYVRGSTTKWSNHAYATAIDLNALQNALGQHGNMPDFIVDAFCRQGAMWGGWYVNRPDWMHFEFVDNGGRKPKSPPPVWPPLGIPHLLAEPEPDAAPADELEPVSAADNAHEGEPTPPPLNVQPETAQYNLDVEILQRKLVKMNYHEIGDVDGLWGGKTRGAVTAFMNDRGQPTDGTFTQPVTNEINKAIAENWSRPIAPARANATAKDIAPKVESVRLNLWQRFCAKVAAGFAALGFTGSSLSGYFESVQDKLSSVHDLFAKIPPEVWFLIVGGVAALVWYASTRAAQASAKDFNTGRLN